jgi:hypothetical protein
MMKIMSFFKVVITRCLSHFHVSGEHPYVELFGVRSFSRFVKLEALKWHWDDEDRLITVLHDTNWKFQFDNQLPFKLMKNESIYIPAGVWHRLHKGSNNFTIEISR